MMEQLVFGREFFALLEQEDERLAGDVAAAGCPVCGGPLYHSDYNRKPRGALIAAGAEASVRRFSLCCGREGCRHRATPPSLRFLGRRVYVGAVVIVASIVGLVLQTAAAIRKATGVPARTVRRWRSWWQGPFLTTSVFLAVHARLLGVAVEAVPKSIMDRLCGSAEQRMQTMLSLLAPLTTCSVTDGARFLRAPGGGPE
jgi:hypothetical protein